MDALIVSLIAVVFVALPGAVAIGLGFLIVEGVEQIKREEVL